MKRLFAFVLMALLAVPAVGQPPNPAPPRPVPMPAGKAHARGYVRPKNLDAMMRASFARHKERLKQVQAVPLPAQYEAPYQIPQQNQGDCGDCWCVSGCITCSNAFVSAGQAKADGTFIIAPDAVLWCNSTGGCDGDDFSTVFNLCQSGGLPIQACFGDYQDTDRGKCNSSCQTYKLTTWGYVNTDTNTPATYTQIKAAIFEWGTVGITVDASGFDNYTSGVMTYKGRGTDHQIIATGWDDNYSDSSYTGKVLHIKNQWGDWGMTGGPNNEPGYGYLAVFSDDTIAASGSSEVAWAEVGNGPTPPGPAPVGPAFQNGSIPTGTVGTLYSYQFNATGTPAPTFTIASGTLPAWANMTTGGLLSGMPTVAAATAFAVTATNSAGTATENVTLTVNSPAPPPPPPAPGAPVANMSVSTLSGSALAIDASTSENVVNYEFYYSPTPAFSMVGNEGSKVVILPATGTAYQTVVLVGWAADGKTHNINVQTLPLETKPVAPVNPPKPPTPPVPAPGGVSVLILDETSDYGTPQYAPYLDAMNGAATVAWLNTHTAKEPNGRPSWRHWDKDVVLQGETKFWKDAKNETLAAFPPVPGQPYFPKIAITNGTTAGVIVPMPPNGADLMKLLQKWGGN